MAISISIADYISLKSLCGLLPGRPHIATAYRWSTRGIRGIRLTTYLVGGARMTTLAAFNRFVEEVSAARNSAVVSDRAGSDLTTSQPVTGIPQTRSRRRAIARAEKELDCRGVEADLAAN